MLSGCGVGSVDLEEAAYSRRTERVMHVSLRSINAHTCTKAGLVFLDRLDKDELTEKNLPSFTSSVDESVAVAVIHGC